MKISIATYKRNEEVRDRMGSAVLHLQQGQLHDREGSLDEAIITYTRAIHTDPTCYKAFYHRARVLGKKGDLEGALGDLSTAIRLHPAYAEAYVARGMILSGKGRVESAVRNFEHALLVAGSNWKYKGQVQESLKSLQEKYFGRGGRGFSCTVTRFGPVTIGI